MSVYPISGKWDLMYFPRAASTLFTANGFVSFTGNGASGVTVEIADASDATLLGIATRTITAASDDYATANTIGVLVPAEKTAEFECDAVAGTMVAADVGLFVDLTSAVAVNRAASSTDVCLVTKFISTTKGRFTLNLPTIKQ
jgi:hypothetical protein